MVFELFIKTILILLYIIATGYVFTFGKSKTGIFKDYVIFVILIVLMLIRM